MNDNNIIELNGKRYDAESGHLIGSRPAKGGGSSSKRKSIDGFVSQSSDHQQKTKEPKAATTPKLALIESSRTKRAHSVAKNVSPHKGEHSKTLARRSVKKPTRSSRTTASKANSLPAKKGVKLPPTKHEVDENRQSRAKHTSRSKYISRFQPHRLSMTGIGQAASVALPLRVKPTRISKKPSTPHHSKANDILMEGLARADSHNEPQIEIKKRHKIAKKVISWSIIAVIFILVGGFFLFKVPVVNLEMVSLRAGVNASTPTYRPGGFVLSTPIHYSQGSVKLVYRSSQGTSFSLTETKSDWDSTSLRDEFVSPTGEAFQTVQSDGLNIYTYGSGQATWVSGGIWYQIGGTANLDQTQITKIAASL